MMATFQVYNEEVDTYGIMHHARYLYWFERVRWLWLKAVAPAEHGYVFPVRALSADYLKPARLGDKLQVSCERQSLGSCSMVFKQDMCSSDRTYAKAIVKVACLDQSFKICKLPPWLLEH